MARAQLRRYAVKEGVMDEFAAVWAEHVVPARAAYGFRVLSAWRSEDGRRFGWVVAHDGDFESAEKAYYDSPERAALPQDPASFLEGVETEMVEVLPQ